MHSVRVCALGDNWFHEMGLDVVGPSYVVHTRYHTYKQDEETAKNSSNSQNKQDKTERQLICMNLHIRLLYTPEYHIVLILIVVFNKSSCGCACMYRILIDWWCIGTIQNMQQNPACCLPLSTYCTNILSSVWHCLSVCLPFVARTFLPTVSYQVTPQVVHRSKLS